MRVAVFTNQFPSQVSTFFARDMRGLIHAGFDIDIFPIHPLEPALWRYVPDILNERILPRSKVHHVPVGRALAVASAPALAARCLRYSAPIGVSAVRYGIGPLAKTAYVFLKAYAAAQEYQGERYDHVLSYWGSYAATYAYLFHRLTNPAIPFSMFLHAGDLYDDQVYLQQKLLYADNIFVVCEFNREFIRVHYQSIFQRVASRVHVYHPSLDLSEFPYQPDGGRSQKILAVGRFDRCKGFDYLLRAVDYLARQGTDVTVDLIGDGDEAGALKALARELGLENKVAFLGWLPFDQVRGAMAGAAMLVHPSSELGDAVPTVIKEALALGTPVIGTAVAGIPELLDYGRCGVLVAPGTVAQLGDAIKTLASDGVVRRSYATKARAYADATFDLWRNSERLATTLRSTSRHVIG